MVPEERPLIAAVFWNRLAREMPLQADPTVQYAVRRERGTLTRADLEVDHPYNTYRYAGLPPGPIASPGLSSIEAVLNPAAGLLPVLRGPGRPPPPVLHHAGTAQCGRGPLSPDAPARVRDDGARVVRAITRSTMPRPTLIPARAGADAVALPRRTLYRTLRSWLRPPVTRFFPLTVEGAEHLPLRGPVHHRRQPPQLPGWGGAGPRRAGADRVHRDAACLPRHASAPALPRSHRLDPHQSRAARRRWAPPRAQCPRARRHRRDLSRGALQRARPAGAWPAGRRAPGPPRAGARRARGNPGNLRGPPRPSLLSPATASGHRALRSRRGASTPTSRAAARRAPPSPGASWTTSPPSCTAEPP